MTAGQVEARPPQREESWLRTVLRDRRLWAQETSTEAGRSRVLEELDRLLEDVGGQMTARASDMAAVEARVELGELTPKEAAEARRDYRTWHAAASRFRGVVKDRIRELRPLVADTHRRLSEHANRNRELVIALAKGIYLHQSEELDDAGLYGLLEELTISDGIGGQVSLFTLACRVLGETTKTGAHDG